MFVFGDINDFEQFFLGERTMVREKSNDASPV